MIILFLGFSFLNFFKIVVGSNPELNTTKYSVAKCPLDDGDRPCYCCHLYLVCTGAPWNGLEVRLEASLHQSSGAYNNRDDLYVLQIPCLSEVILEVLVLIQLFSLRPIQSKVVRDGYLNDLGLPLLFVPNDNVRLYSPSFHIPAEDNRFVVENGYFLCGSDRLGPMDLTF